MSNKWQCKICTKPNYYYCKSI
ncbi:MAG: hypothetical protein ACEQSR_14605 [Candidatus Methylacidiphilales bacterium]